jgi:hypothetical protein
MLEMASPSSNPALISIRAEAFVKKKIRSIVFFRNQNERLLLIQFLSYLSLGSHFQGILRSLAGGDSMVQAISA